MLENAIKYTPEHGRLALSSIRIGGELSVTLADNGPGIPVAERRNVFRRFYRLDQSRGSRGNGLGLSMVQAVIGLHGGAIELADNHPGLRTIIRLPVAPRPPARLPVARCDTPAAALPHQRAVSE